MNNHYIPLKCARRMLADRIKLRAEVEKYWAMKNGTFPFVIPQRRYFSVFARQLATFRFEDACFILRSEQAGFNPAWLPYTADLFVVRSALKRSYLRPLLSEHCNKHGELIVQNGKIVTRMDLWSGKRLQDVLTDDGDRLVDWHLRRLRTAYPEAYVFDEHICNKQWCGSSIEDRYEAFLSLFVAHMVLFEDYHGGESGLALDDFTAKVFEPAFQRVLQRFGVRPLIVTMPWRQEYSYYPHGVLLETWRSSSVLSE